MLDINKPDTMLFKFNCKVVSSTNDLALKLLNNIDFVVITTQQQTQGRGRNGKNWYGNKDENLYYSLGLNHNTSVLPIYMLQIVGGLAVYNVLNEMYGNLFVLKYPNDVYGVIVHNGIKIAKKISGIASETNILAETHCESVIGIGINVLQTNFTEAVRDNTTSLKLMGIKCDNKDITNLANKLTTELANLLNLSEEEVFSKWRSKLNMVGKEIMILSEGNDNILYRFSYILADGRLVLISPEGEERIINNGDSIRYDLL